MIQVTAHDADSEHFGRVSYALTGDSAYFDIDNAGWVTVKKEIDRERVIVCRLMDQFSPLEERVSFEHRSERRRTPCIKRFVVAADHRDRRERQRSPICLLQFYRSCAGAFSCSSVSFAVR